MAVLSICRNIDSGTENDHSNELRYGREGNADALLLETKGRKGKQMITQCLDVGLNEAEAVTVVNVYSNVLKTENIPREAHSAEYFSS